MRKLRIAAALAAAALAMPAAAQVPDRPATEGKTPPKPALKKAHRTPKAAKPGLAEPAFIVPPPAASAADPSLERRRRAFFARPDDVGISSEPTAPVGVTLGGSGGITPGMGFKF